MTTEQARKPGVEVVITGMGAVTPVSDTVEGLWAALVAGQSAITRWSWADERYYSQIGGDLTDWDLEQHLATVGTEWPVEIVRRARRLLRTTPLGGRSACAAALQALADAGWPELESERFGHCLAGHNLNTGYIARNVRLMADDPDGIEPLTGLYMLDTDSLSVVSELVGARGPTSVIGNACASGNMALMWALDLLRGGRADAVLVTSGGFELDQVILQGWALIDALSIRSFNDAPERASRPFDALREGFVPSMMAGALLLERADHALARGARIHARLMGASSVSNACRQPRPDRDGQARAMRLALVDAGVTPGEVDYVNAHATSTPIGDVVEVEAVRAVLGRRAEQVPVNATKSILGHGLMAAGVIEAIATVLQMAHGTVHPTINLEVPDPAMELDFVPRRARPYCMDIALSNSFGFGGLNACVVLGRAA